MLKIIFLIVIVISFIAYTGINVTSEYDAISKIRNQAFENIIDPLVKIILKQVSDFNLDEIVDGQLQIIGRGD